MNPTFSHSSVFNRNFFSVHNVKIDILLTNVLECVVGILKLLSTRILLLVLNNITL